MTDSYDDDRRLIPDRRAGMDRRDGRDRRRIEDRLNARRLPDEFAQAAGGSDDRVTGLVNRYWAGYAEPAKGQLAQALLPVLEELVEPGAPVTEHHREKCVEVVVDWSERMEPVSMD
jgi:hypothetical protein